MEEAFQVYFSKAKDLTVYTWLQALLPGLVPEKGHGFHLCNQFAMGYRQYQELFPPTSWLTGLWVQAW